METRKHTSDNTEKETLNLSSEDVWLQMTVDSDSLDSIRVSLEGWLLEQNSGSFKAAIHRIVADRYNTSVIVDCDELEILGVRAIWAIRELLDEGISISFTNLNQDSYAALWEARLTSVAGIHTEIPHIDVNDCPIIGKGANGIVYRIDEELILKTFKNDEPLENIISERYLTKCAFKVGIPCPISFGLAEVDGKLALLMEMVKSKSLLKCVYENPSSIEQHAEAAVRLVKNLHSVKGDQLVLFPRKTRYMSLLKKADKLDEYMDQGHKGKLRMILEGINQEEVLTHGDLQPGNIRVGENGLSFIDLETLSTGPEIMDIGAIRRSLFCDWEFAGLDYSQFLKLPKDLCIEIWDTFIKYYYMGEESETIRANLLLAEIIGDIMSASQYRKRGHIDQLNKAIERLVVLMDMQET